MAFEGIKTTNWFMNVDAARVENGEQLVAIMAADQKEIAIDSVLVDEYDKNEIALDFKGLALETKVDEKKTRKRSSDGRENPQLFSIKLMWISIPMVWKPKLMRSKQGRGSRRVRMGEKAERNAYFGSYVEKHRLKLL